MRDVQQVDWASFRVTNDGAYGGGSELGHHREQCDWTAGIDDLNPLEISELAAGHAAECTGEPMPRPEPGPRSAMGDLVASVWGDQIVAALARQPLATVEVSAPGTGAPGA